MKLIIGFKKGDLVKYKSWDNYRFGIIQKINRTKIYLCYGDSKKGAIWYRNTKYDEIIDLKKTEVTKCMRSFWKELFWKIKYRLTS